MSGAGEARTRAGFADPADADRFLEKLGQYERGEIGPDDWRAFRLLRGTYPQRQEGVNMLRVKLPQGVVGAAQLRALADVAAGHSRGFLHVTTRQNVQLHFVPTASLGPAMARLAQDGLTTVEACGNSVRNVVGCPDAGVSADEVFDPTPYAEALTRHFLRLPLASTLPRKFKIAFEGCAQDHVLTAIHDLGFRARVVDGRRGFAVGAAGGTATLCTSAYPLAAFLPAGELLSFTEAVLQVFHRLGDRQNRKKNRMKFLVKQLGFDRFKAEVEAELAAVRARGGVPLPFDPEAPPAEGPPATRGPVPSPAALAALVAEAPVRGPGVVPAVATTLSPAPAALETWRRTNVRPQRQAGFVLATVALPIGDLTSGQLRALALVAEAYGDATVRFTPRQDLVLRWVPAEVVPALHGALAAAGLARDGAGTAGNVVSCPGAESCRLAVTRSRGIAEAVEARVRGDAALAALPADVNVSGCPNGCGQHHVSAIGLQGSARKVDGRPAPQYFVLVGGGDAGDGKAAFGRIAAKVPARRAPEAVARLLGLYQRERAAGEDASRFFRRLPADQVKALLRDLEPLDPAAVDPQDFVDLGDDQPFVVTSEG
ncbi:MAG: nitrite/sulfite reductase [Anaeromyxobacter sp.]